MSPSISFLPGEEKQQNERYRHMPPGEKWEVMSELNRLEDERQRAEIRARYGNISQADMRIHLGIVRLGRELVEKVVGRDEVARVLKTD
jgi:hypothetical protein